MTDLELGRIRRMCSDMTSLGLDYEWAARLMLSEVERLRRLELAVREAHSQVADDRCWMDVSAVYAAAGLPPPDRRVGDKFEMIKNCVRFVEAHCEGGGWASYQELRQRHAALAEAVRDVHRVVSAALDSPGRPAGHTAEAVAHAASTVEAALRKDAGYARPDSPDINRAGEPAAEIDRESFLRP